MRFGLYDTARIKRLFLEGFSPEEIHRAFSTCTDCSLEDVTRALKEIFRTEDLELERRLVSKEGYDCTNACNILAEKFSFEPLEENGKYVLQYYSAECKKFESADISKSEYNALREVFEETK